MKSLTLLLVIALSVAFGVCPKAEAAPLTGSHVAYFSSHEGTTSSISIDLGGTTYSTGTITSSLDLTNPLNSFEIFDFDTMTVIEEVDVIVNAPLFAALGVAPIKLHSVETGTFTILSSSEPSPGEWVYELETELNGTVVVPPGSVFSGWTWTNRKKQSVSAGCELRPDGTIWCGIRKEWITTAGISDPNGVSYDTEGSGRGMLSSTPVPEPSTLLVFGSALTGVAGLYRRRPTSS